jgi:hypothetical protein
MTWRGVLRYLSLLLLEAALAAGVVLLALLTAWMVYAWTGA